MKRAIKLLGAIFIATILCASAVLAAGGSHIISGKAQPQGTNYTPATYKVWMSNNSSQTQSGNCAYSATNYTYFQENLADPGFNSSWTNGQIVIGIMEKANGAESGAGLFTASSVTLSDATTTQNFSPDFPALANVPQPTATVNSAQGRVDLSWTAATAPAGIISGYNVYRSTDGTTFTKINDALVSGTTFSDTAANSTPDPVVGAAYYYAIKIVFTANVESTYRSLRSSQVTYPAAPSAGALQFSAATYTVAENVATIAINVTRTGGSGGVVSVQYATSNGTATSGSDYTSASGTLNWASGDSAVKTFNVTIANDPLDEVDETVNLALSGPTGGATLGTPNTSVLTINDDDAAPTVAFSAASSNGLESTTPANLAVALSAASGQTVTVNYSVTGGTATGSGTDYTLASGTLTFNPGETTKNISATIVDDAIIEGAETIIVTLAAPTNATLGLLTNHTYTINDNDTAADPQVTSITWEPGKDSGYVYGTINLNGTNFGATQGTSTVALQFQGGAYNNLGAAQIYYWSDTKIQVGVPISISGTYAVAGTTNARVTVNAKNASNTFSLKPKVYSVTPNNGPVGTSVAIEGTAFNQTAAGNSISFNGTAASAGSIVNAADKSTLTVAVPAGATTGQLLVTANSQTSNTHYDWAPFDQIVFTVTSAAQPTITTNSLPNGTVATAYNQTLQAMGGTAPYTWAITVGSLPAGLSLNTSTGVISGTPTTAQTANFTVQVTDAAAKTATKALSITIDPAGVVSDPSISGISPASAYAGQTLIINGSHFGSSGTITIGGINTQPTVWTDGQIIASIPTGVATGSAAIIVSVGGKSTDSTVTVDNSRIYLDDFEGGSVGNFTAPGTNTGYYTFGTGIAPDNANINASGPQSEAAKEGAKGMKVKYSYTSDWGGGWGAKLANQLDLSSADKINFYITWDGSSNDVKVSLKDADGTAVAATVTNAALAAVSGYGQVSLDKSSLVYDKDGSDAAANASFDWTKVNGCNFVYTTKGTTSNYHYIDSLYASVGSTPPIPPSSTESPVITSIDPTAGPAGTKLTIIGYNFRDKETSTSRKVLFISASNTIIEAAIVSWESTRIVLTVPNTLGTGTYDIKVLVEFPSASDPSIIRSFYSNPAAFMVTAVAPGPGAIIAYPTPFNPNTGVPLKIEFDPGTATNIGVYIFDMTAKLVSRQTVTGSPVTWNGVDMYGATVGDGVFLVRIVNNENQGLIAKGKILVVKKQ
ncbi:MAG: Calx-beta domain-containing protein [Candidatus Margulisiibacteriota bacterium]|jgi:hypothetical protein